MSDNMQSQAELAANAAQSVMREHKAAKNAPGPKIVMPGGKIVDATPYLRNRFKSQQMASVLNEIDVYPDRFLKNPKPGYHYGWIALKDLTAQGRIRSGRYQAIKPDEMRDDTNLPYSTHKGPTSQMVMVYDVLLVGIPPQVWEEDYESRQDMAVSQLAGHHDSFYSGMENQGAATAEMEVQVHK